MSVIQVGLKFDTTGKLDAELVQPVAAALTLTGDARPAPVFRERASHRAVLAWRRQGSRGVWPVNLGGQPAARRRPGSTWTGITSLTQKSLPLRRAMNGPLMPATKRWKCWSIPTPTGCKETSNAIGIGPEEYDCGRARPVRLPRDEACDPCEADSCTPMRDPRVSQCRILLRPHFYDPVTTPGTRYSFTGAIKAPRQILPGGYISWVNQATGEVTQQLLWVGPESAADHSNPRSPLRRA